jgi:hypothetical protein
MRQKSLCMILACLLVAGFAIAASATDTSPYLVSDFYTDTLELDAYTSFFIVNPTPIELTVFAAFYDSDGVFSTCRYYNLDGNETWNVDIRNLPVPETGTAKFFAFPLPTAKLGLSPKFFAFPVSTLKFDPNAVIGGFKQEIDCDYVMTGAFTEIIGTGPITSTVNLVTEYNWVDRVREVNIKAVTINSSTTGEFADILKRPCTYYTGEYIRPRDYCATLPKPLQ